MSSWNARGLAGSDRRGPGRLRRSCGGEVDKVKSRHPAWLRRPALARTEPPCRAPAPGRYKLHVRGRQLGSDGGMAPIRGSPFAIQAADPWEQQALAGAAPTRRAGATLTSLGSDLVLFGGDKSLAAVCHAPAAGAAEQQPWQWASTGEAERPVARKGHAAAAVAPGKLLVCGGTALEGEPADLTDVRILHTEGTRFAGASWAWEAAAALQPELHQRADGSLVPTERAGHCAAVLGGRTLVVFGGEHHGQLLQELCLLDMSSKVGGWGSQACPLAHPLVAVDCRMRALPICLLPVAIPLNTGAPLGGAGRRGRAALRPPQRLCRHLWRLCGHFWRLRCR